MNNRNIAHIVFFLLIIGNIIGCKNKPEETVQRQLFDLNWKVAYGDHISAYAFDFNDHNWQNIDLPHTWSNDSEPTNLTSGTVWYRKHFEIPEHWINKKILIDFQGISNNYELFVNGTVIPDSYNEKNSVLAYLNPYLNQTTGKNVIVVRLTIPQNKKDSLDSKVGIYKNVWLVVKHDKN